MFQFLLGELPPTHSFSASKKETQHVPANTQFPEWTGFLLRSLAPAITLIVESRQFFDQNMGLNKPFKPSSKIILENIPVHNTQCRLPVFYQTHSPIVATFVLVGHAADLYNNFPEVFSCAPALFGTWQFLACSSQQLSQLCNATEKIQELRLLCTSSTAKELLAFKMAKQMILN